MGGERVIAITEDIVALIEEARLLVKVKNRIFLLYEDS